MLFFPTAYPDELLFSICSRYFIRSGNISYKSALDDLFSNRSLTNSIILPSGISSLVKNLPPYSSIDEQKLIYLNTLYLFYTAFLPANRAKSIYNAMCSDDGRSIYGSSGVLASSITQNKYLRFCRDCMNEDKKNYGEYYWHRSHQISGIQCCLTHYKPLYDSSIEVVGVNKHRFQIPTLENCNAKKSVLDDVSKQTQKDYIDLCNKIYENLIKLMVHPFKHRGIGEFQEFYKSKLLEYNFSYYTGRVKQKEWRDYFTSIFNQEVLQLFSTPLKGELDWLTLIVQKHRKTFHPIRHLLLMFALNIEVADLFEKDKAIRPFGSPKWPCLNPVCSYYKVPIIEEVEITLSEKSKEPIGTFTCPCCDFSYTRRGPDKDENDKFCKTRVKKYGHVWMSKLKEYSNLNIGLRELSRKMGADSNTIRRYLNNEKSNSVKILTPSKRDRENWLILQRNFPNKNTKQLKQEEKALYMRLYRKDREWLQENCPKLNQAIPHERIDWTMRDNEVLNLVTNAVEKLLNSEEKPIRITINRIGNLIGNRALLEKKLDKMPKTKAYLKSKVETVEQFQQRRIIYTIKEFRKRGEDIVPWKILRRSGIKDYSKWFEFVQDIISKGKY